MSILSETSIRAFKRAQGWPFSAAKQRDLARALFSNLARVDFEDLDLSRD
jgi:hypothetical protein